MRRLIFLALLFCLTLPNLAQENNPTPYEIAMTQIRDAEASGATRLSFSGLGLRELPPEIGKLRQLLQLVLDNNQLTDVPAEIGNLDNLQYLHLADNQLTSVPAEIVNLNNLRILDLSKNYFTSLPLEITNLRDLRSLLMDNNQLTSLPAEIGKLGNLEDLALESNTLANLPTEIANLQKLCHLYLNNNQFRQLPTELSQIESLRDENCGIYLEGNPLISPPAEVIAQGTPAILEYLENEAWWHLQRLIVGGASSLGLVAAAVLGIRWRQRGKEKKKRL
jgi:Leucine-rich repeat (LRR) protein